MNVWVLSNDKMLRKAAKEGTLVYECIRHLIDMGHTVFLTDCDMNDDTTSYNCEPDIIVSLYYLHIIKQPLIDRVKGKIFNAHASLLPRHRGRSPVPWAIINGDKMTGITYHYIDAGIDTGNILLQAAIQIDYNETQASLFDKINQAVIDYFPMAFNLVLSGFEGIKQTGKSNYHFAGCPYNGEINPNWSTDKIKRFIRAMIYPPKPYAKYKGIEVKSWEQYLEQRYHNISV